MGATDPNRRSGLLHLWDKERDKSGAGGTRTPYLFNAIEALSQMSYSPKLPPGGTPSARQYSKGPWFRQGRDA